MVSEKCSFLSTSVVFFPQLQICDFIQSATVSRITDQKVPFATFASAWVGYDDMESILHKVKEYNLFFPKRPPPDIWSQRSLNFKTVDVLVL